MTTTGGSPRRRSVAAPLTAVVIGFVLIGLELSQGASPAPAAEGGAILFAYALALWFFQNRSDAVSVLAGRPVDELWQTINQKAMAVAATLAAMVALAGFGLMVLLGRESWQFGSMAGVLGLGYIGAIIWYKWRL